MIQLYLFTMECCNNKTNTNQTREKIAWFSHRHFIRLIHSAQNNVNVNNRQRQQKTDF